MDEILINNPAYVDGIFKEFDFLNQKESQIRNESHENENSKNESKNISINKNNANNYNHNSNYYNSYIYDNCNNHHNKTVNYNKNETVSDSDRNYFLAQAYVYEDLLNINLFSEIDWKNKANEDEDEVEVILMNHNKYKVKQSGFPYDFVAKTLDNKTFNINVKNGVDTTNRYLKFIFTFEQLRLFNNEREKVILAFINLQNNNKPKI